ncbi:MAG: iron chaperone [Carnobacterium inhibens]|uniref:iron chaperone n=1 Tax=Carnobacterium TaxID=2747 RepID=UPI00054E3B91|nr:iron chaperone [Carnobacterium inhibens]
MDIFSDYLANIDNIQQRERTGEVLTWVAKTFPKLKPRVGWNQPMFTDHDTFIIGFSVSKNHMSVAPEKAGIRQFSNEIVQAGYNPTKEIFRIQWNSPIDFSLLEKIIEFNILDKADCSTFWRK